MLKARLFEHEMQRREEENKKEINSKTDIGWGTKLDLMYYNHINS